MKKHQKVLLGIMALSLAGGTGTAVALTFKPSAGTSTSVPTDGAIYLYWGTQNQNDATQLELTNFVENTPQYRPIVVVPESSKNVTGRVTLDFTLATGQKSSGGDISTSDADGNTYVLPGLTVSVFEAKESNFDSANSYAYLSEATDHVDTTTKTYSMSISSEGSASTQVGFDVKKVDTSSEGDINYHKTTQWYLLEFLWDGTRPGQNEAFGGNLTISQSFKAA